MGKIPTGANGQNAKGVNLANCQGGGGKEANIFTGRGDIASFAQML